MKIERMTKDEQLSMLVRGRWWDAVREKFDVDDPRDIITVSRNDLVEYFQKNPELALKSFEAWSKDRGALPYHDIGALWREGDDYKVAWMDHGKPTNLLSFSNLDDALATFIFYQAGLSLK